MTLLISNFSCYFGINRRSLLNLDFIPDTPKSLFRVVRDNIGLLSKAFKNQFVIPEFGPFCKQVTVVMIYKYCVHLKNLTDVILLKKPEN